MRGRIEIEKIYDEAFLEMPSEFTSYDFKSECRKKGLLHEDFMRYFVVKYLRKMNCDNGSHKSKTWTKDAKTTPSVEPTPSIEQPTEITLEQAIEVIKQNGGKVLMPIMTEI